MKHSTSSLLISHRALLAAFLLASAAGAGDLADVTPAVYDDVPPETLPFGPTHYWAGAAWGDVDGDDDPDLFVTDYFDENRLYLNEPGLPGGPARILMWAAGAIDGDPGGAGEGAVFADFDGDGDLDLYVVNQGGTPNKLYENDGSGAFADVSAGSGVDSPDFGEGCTAGDVDGDGLVDVYLTNYGDPGDPLNPGAPNALFVNTGGMTFADATSDFGLPPLVERSGACSLVDYDGDGDLDLFEGNHGMPNHLYENVGGAFVDVTLAVGGAELADADGGCFGARWFDGDNDGDLDLYVSNMVSSFAADGVNKVYESGVAGGSKDLTLVPTGADSAGDGMSVSACDLDLDRNLDLALAAFGANEVFLGGSLGVDLAPAAPGYLPEPFPDTTSSATSADFDMDGDLDLFFGGSGTVFAYENLGDAGRGSVVLRFSGDATEPFAVPADGLGTSARAWIDVGLPELEPGPLMVVDSGSGYAQDAREQHVGLELGAETLAALDVTWADGTAETLFGLPELTGSRTDVDVAYPAGITKFGAQTDPTPVELWRGGAEGVYPAASIGSTDFGLVARGFSPGSLHYLIYGTVEIDLLVQGGNLFVLPIATLLGAVDGDVARWSVPVPDAPPLIGFPVLFQSVAIRPTGEVDWSNGVEAVLQP